MRVVKEAEERRNEILDAAEELFAGNGFDNTSTNDIVNTVGIARGTLYYHFKSKEDILDAVIDRLTRQVLAKAAYIASDESLTVLQRMSRSIMALNVNTKIGTEVMEQVHKPQNALMHQKMQETLLNGINPIITKLVIEGMEQGIFHTDYPEVAVEMSMLYSNVAFDDLMEQTPEEMQKRIEGFIYNVEKLLGAKRGTLAEALMEIFIASGSMEK